MPRRNKDQVKARRKKVSGLLLQGNTHAAIADQVGVSRSQVTKDVAAVRVEWNESTIQNYDEHLAQELQRIDGIIKAAWEGFETSKGPNNEFPGNPAFLNVMLKAQDRIIKIRGLGEAYRAENGTNSKEVNIPPIHWVITPEEAREASRKFYTGPEDDL